MLSISSLGAASGDKANYCQSSASAEGKTEGYYQKDDEAGRWNGDPAAMAALGIKPGDRVSDKQFKAITRGINPATGEALVQGAGDQHRAGWDLTFSAPKSVSAVWAVGNDQDRSAIAEAHDKAVAAALEHLQERAAFARRGKAGSEQEKLPGLLVAEYQHSTTRELDPDLHTHSLVMNLAQRSDGTWGGIESKHLYEWKMAAGAIYRAQLAENMQQLGFEVAADRDYFKIEGVPDDLCREWSKRREQIEEALKEAGQEQGNAKAAEIAALGSRKAKNQDQDQDVLRERWTAEAEAYGLNADAISARHLPAVEVAAEEEKSNIYDKLTRTNSTFAEQDLWAAAAIEMQHKGKGLDAVSDRVDELLADGEVVKMRSKTGELRYTTKDMLAVEKGMAETAKRLQVKSSHQVSSEKVEQALADFKAVKGFDLSDEQKAAVRHITENTNGIALVRGAAGAGKSTMAEAARMAWESAGYEVRGAALAGKAAQGLEEGSGIKSQTLHSLLFEIESGKTALNEKTVLVIDEAGMVGSRQMSKLLQNVEKSGAKVVMIGDERQLQAVDAGGAFRAIQKIAGCAELKEIRRQKEAWAREAVEEFSRGEAGNALKSFIDRDLVKIDETKAAAMNSVVEAWHAERDPGKPGEAVMLASTRADVAELNDTAREILKYENALHGFEAQMTNHQGRKLGFMQQDRILFRKNSVAMGVKNGTLGTVEQIKIDPDGSFQLRVKLDDGKIVEFSPNAKENAKENHYDAIEHGYALTTHKSQGITVDKAYVLLGGSMQDRETSYVQMSRARHETKIFLTSSQIDDELDRAGLQPTEKNPSLEDLKQAIKQMETSRQKDTTLDYSVEPAPAPEPEREPDPVPEPAPAFEDELEM